ncbi:MAG: hypothetical protein KIT17_10270 [Rubrivivax sp.]|nr:hypothetical protein [Rubrivivax sp.]
MRCVSKVNAAHDHPADLVPALGACAAGDGQGQRTGHHGAPVVIRICRIGATAAALVFATAA